MKAAWRAADRAAEVRDAAHGWRAAGLIEEATLAAVAAGWPRVGPVYGWVWRSLICFFVGLGIMTFTAGVGASLGIRGEAGFGTLLLLLGVVLAVATEGILERYGYAPTGAEAATAFFSVLYLAGGAAALLGTAHANARAVMQIAFPVTAAILAAAAWRWGFRLFAGAGALFLLLFALLLPAPWLCWTAAAALIAWAATRAVGAAGLAPAHRGGLEIARAVALAAIYLAVNYYAADHGLLRELRRSPGERLTRPGDLALLAAGLGSVLYPIALLLWGVRARDRGILLLGALAAAGSLVTLRFYVHVAPLWVVLAASGALLAVAALLLERWIKAGPAGERGGFTTAPLYHEGRRERLLPVAAAIALAPAARALPEEPRFEGGGGASGGAGASGRF